MRTFEEIEDDVELVVANNNPTRLEELAEELIAEGSPAAQALAVHTLAVREEFIGSAAKALALYEKALEVYLQIGHRARVASTTANIGNALQKMGEYAQSIEAYQKALVLLEEVGHKAGIAALHKNVGDLYMRTGEFPEAIEYLQKSLALYDENNDLDGAAKAMHSIAEVYRNMSMYPESLSYYRKAQHQYATANNQYGIAATEQGIGNVYSAAQSHREALEHYQNAIRHFDAAGLTHITAGTVMNMGIVHMNQGDYEQAEQLFLESRRRFTDTDYKAGVLNATINLVELYLKKGSVDLAAQHFALLEWRTLSNQLHLAACYMINARLLLHHGNKDESWLSMQDALRLLERNGILDMQADVHKDMRELALARNDFAGYVEHNTHHLRLTNEVHSRETTQRLAIMQAELTFEEERRQRERERAILYSALPASVANRVVNGEAVSDNFDDVSVLFLDIVGFTTICANLTAAEVVDLLRSVFAICDQACKTHGLTRIKTIGDSYMAVAGVPEPLTNHTYHAALAALEMITGLKALDVAVRVGLHCGPAVAGIVGEERLQYDVWGDTVNVASRLEGTSEPGRIHVSEAFARSLVVPSEASDLLLIPRGATELKGKGRINTFWLTAPQS